MAGALAGLGWGECSGRPLGSWAPDPNKDTELKTSHFIEGTTKPQGHPRWEGHRLHASEGTPVTHQSCPHVSLTQAHGVAHVLAGASHMHLCCGQLRSRGGCLGWGWGRQTLMVATVRSSTDWPLMTHVVTVLCRP